MHEFSVAHPRVHVLCNVSGAPESCTSDAAVPYSSRESHQGLMLTHLVPRRERMALLEADVDFKVAREFIKNVKEKAATEEKAAAERAAAEEKAAADVRSFAQLHSQQFSKFSSIFSRPIGERFYYMQKKTSSSHV